MIVNCEGHSGVSGLQKHSIGELYPMTVRVVERNDRLYCQAFDCLTGWCGSSYAADEGNFARAHESATNECEVVLGWRK